MQPLTKRAVEPEKLAVRPARCCVVCGAPIPEGEDQRQHCSPRCRAAVWRRSRQRAGLGPRARE